jgi:hypothetical protein
LHKSIPVRLLRLGIAALIGLGIAIPLRVSLTAHTGPIAGVLYNALFDLNFRSSQPAVYHAISHDTALYDLVEQQTEQAWLKDGWPGARRTFHSTSAEHVLIYADDFELLEMARAYSIVEAGLVVDPERCRRYGLNGDYDEAWQPTARQWRIATNAFDAAVESGERRRHDAIRTPRPPENAWWEAFVLGYRRAKADASDPHGQATARAGGRHTVVLTGGSPGAMAKSGLPCRRRLLPPTMAV